MSVRTGKTCCVVLFLTWVFTAPVALSAPTDCVQDAHDGRVACTTPLPNPIGITPCDNAADFVSRQRAWCEASGSEWAGGTCPGFTPYTDEDVIARAIRFGAILHGDPGCGLTSDTDWNATFPGTVFCNGGGGQVFDSGYLIRDARRITLSCGETIHIAKSRSLACPHGTSARTTPRGSECAYPLEPCDNCNKVGNPALPATGVKVQTESDYRHPRGLSFNRYYHSFGFVEPFTLTAFGHTPSQLGSMWRSDYDKRVIPLGGTTHVTALTFPNGELNYFDSSGREIFNLRGASAALAGLPDGGYVYSGPETTETYRADGRLQAIAGRSGQVLTLTYSDGTSGPGGGFFVDRAGNPTNFVLSANLLIRVSDSHGNALSFAYGASGKLIVMTDPSGARTLYSYDTGVGSVSIEHLASVTYPDGRIRRYKYNEPPNMPPGATFMIDKLTSIVDENGAVFASFKYDISGRIISTEHSGGAGRYQLSYDWSSAPTLKTTVIDPLGAARLFTFPNVDGLQRLTANSQPGGAGFGTGVQDRTYDATGNILSETDFNQNKTCYVYDTVRNLATVRVEGLAAATSCDAVTVSGATLPSGGRKVLTAWHPRWRVPVSTSEPNRITTYVYNGDASCAPASAVIPDGTPNGQPIGVLCAKTLQSTSDADGGQGFGAALQGQPRTWNYTYNAHGNVLTADGPRIDVADITTTAYYADDDANPGKRGNVATIRNALNHLTSIIDYNAHGQPLTIVDANGLTTNLGYDERQRLSSRDVGGEITRYDYDSAGQLTKVTLPDASFLSYGYDDAHRLTGITDNLGNHITYTLDAMGNRTKEEVFDPASRLAQTRSRVFNILNRLFQDLGAQSQTTTYGYDNQGNLTSIDSPLEGAADTTINAYDALNRLIRVTDPNQGQTQYAYDGIDQLVGVTDQRNLATSYEIDGLANLNSQASPDTGSTLNTYDAAGNLLTQKDAKNQVTTYVYDALNRVTSITFHDGSKQTYAYDQGPNGIGRLSSITETDPQNQVTSLIAYGYDQHGRTTSETRTIAGVAYTLGYSYDSAGRLAGLTYPSGRTIACTFDALGRINQVSTTPQGGTAQVVASSIAYQPFGGVKSYTLGNGQSYTRGFDLDGRIASYSLGSQVFALNYDEASRIRMISETGNAANMNTYDYDLLDRLTSAVLPNLPFAYGYDAVGNRNSKTVGSSTDSYVYSTTSNRLASVIPQGGAARNFSFDPNGSTTADGNNTYVYDTRGRMVQSTGALGTTTYQVNALGQRIRKTNSTEDRVYLYDTRGRLIAETDPGGALKREYIYLNDIPLAVIQ